MTPLLHGTAPKLLPRVVDERVHFVASRPRCQPTVGIGPDR